MPHRFAAALCALLASLVVVAAGPGHALAGPAGAPAGRFAATFTVTAPTGNGAGTLSAAITAANTTPEADRIVFDLAGPPHRIVGATLPAITAPVTIDGFTASGAQAPDAAGRFQPSVTIIGGANLTVRSSGVTVRGLAFRGFAGTAITTAAAADGSALTGVVIRENVVGIEAGQTACGTGASRSGGDRGIQLRGVRGALVTRNVVGCNTTGIDVGSDVVGSRITENGVGVLGGVPFGNVSVGIRVEGTGGSTGVAAARNLIGANLVAHNGSGAAGDAGIAILTGTQTIRVVGNAVGQNAGDGIALGRRQQPGTGGTGHTVRGNEVGLWSTLGGFPTARTAGAAPNTGAGIVVAESDSTVVGGFAAAERNVVSHNRGWGVEVWGAAVYPGQLSSYGTTVLGNAVGVTAGGSVASPSAGNGLGGILVRSSRSNTIGVPGAGNVVGSNGTLAARGTGHGVAVVGGSFNRLDANRIGIDAAGAVAPNEGAGIYVERSVQTRIGALANGPADYNVVAYNGSAGLQIGATPTEDGQLSNQTTLRYTNLFANGGLEVDLGGDGRTANDPGDADAGPDGLQNFPVVAAIVPSGSGFAARITMDATVGQRYTFTFYRGGAPGADGQTPQALYLGEQEATASGTPLTLLTQPIPGLAQGDFLVVAASSAAADGGVGELSDPVRAGGPAPLFVQLIHNSNGLSFLGPLDVYLNGALRAEDVAFGRGGTGFQEVPAGQSVSVTVTPANQPASSGFTLAISTPAGGGRYTVTVIGSQEQVLSLLSNPFDRDLALKLVTVVREPSRPVSAEPLRGEGAVVRVYAVHAGTDAPPLTFVIPAIGTTIAANLDYGQASAPVALAPGTYAVEVRDARDGAVLRTVTLALAPQDGQTVQLSAAGFLDPSRNNNGPGFFLASVTAAGGVVTAGEDDPVGTDALSLASSRPNPARGPALIAYSLREAGPVRLAVYDALGREVAVLADGEHAAGRHEVALGAGRLAAGVYVVRLVAGEAALVRRLTVVR